MFVAFRRRVGMTREAEPRMIAHRVRIEAIRPPWAGVYPGRHSMPWLHPFSGL